MTRLRTLSTALALTAASLLAACTTAPSMPMAHASAAAPAGSMAMMDAQMKTMREQREKMMKARTPQERQALMADHRKAMQGGMAMMQGGGMGGAGGMQGMQGMQGAPGSPQHAMMMEKRMEMMQGMMEMMMDRVPAAEHGH